MVMIRRKSHLSYLDNNYLQNSTILVQELRSRIHLIVISMGVSIAKISKHSNTRYYFISVCSTVITPLPSLFIFTETLPASLLLFRSLFVLSLNCFFSVLSFYQSIFCSLQLLLALNCSFLVRQLVM